MPSTSTGSLFINTTSAVSTATSVPAPIATPTAAWASGGVVDAVADHRDALVLWICSLPLVALLTLDTSAARIAAGAALIAWVAGCLWAFGPSAEST